jgi:hypothetical protein
MAALALQVLVPTVALVGVVALGWERPMRAGWQMFSAPAQNEDRIELALPGGATEERATADYLLNRREMHVDRALLRRLCAAEPDAIALTGPDGTRVVC